MENLQISNLLQKYFGYEDFRDGQREVIEQILSKKDVLAIMPTGAGKSICYQLPSLIFDGVTIVISPLISLMKDQVDTLSETGIEAAFINSSLSAKKLENIIANAKLGMYKLIYVAPERLDSDSFSSLLKSIKVSLVAIDEAHCVSQWGHDFRPSYTRIANITNYLPERPVMAAFTATATPQVKSDIINLLELKQPFSLTTGFDRANLYFEVVKPAKKLNYLLDFLNDNKSKSGIIYAATRKTVESVADKLISKGFNATSYHAGLSEKTRTKNQEDFLYDRVRIMVATNAFGMGIDKSNISYVVHYNMPKNMESYYQEAGRSGRDGENADCILLFSAADIITNKFLIELGGENFDKTNDYQKLNEIVDYCNIDKCLRKYILEYFGENTSKESCDNCGNCNNDIQQTDITTEVQKIFSCIKRMNERFGTGLVTDVLRGSNSEKIKSMGFNNLSTFGIMKEYPKTTIKEIISFLIADGYISLNGDKFPTLKLNQSSYDILQGKKRITFKRLVVKQKPQVADDSTVDMDLFEILRLLRKRLAEEQNVPPFVVFSDVTLKGMSSAYPVTNEEMLEISGVGAFKLDKYGGEFISAIKEYKNLKCVERG